MVKKLLFIRFWGKSGISGGGEQLTNTNLEYIFDILGKDNVDVFAVNSNINLSFFKKLIYFFNFFKNYHRGLTSKKINHILSIASQYDFIFIDRSVFGIIAQKLKKANYNGKIITFFHNFEQNYYLDHATLISKSVKYNENCACQYSDMIIALNERDQKLIEHHYNRKADFLIPISFKDRYTPSPEVMNKPVENPLNCLFVGSYFDANTEGILWFIQEVFPQVNIRLQIVGKGMAQLKTKFPHNSRIEILDSVPDLTPFYENADYMIMPIFKGSGMKVKTCEALMYGKNIIGSTEAFEGYNVDYEKIGAFANTKEEFIEAIHTFENQSKLRFNKYARICFLNSYSSGIISSHFKQILI